MMKQKIHYKVKDGCNSPVIFETLDEAVEYLTNCLDGINNGQPVSIEKISDMAHLIELHLPTPTSKELPKDNK